MKKIGFDIHGVIDENPVLFSEIISEFKRNGYEIHILTGSMVTDELIAELKGYNIEYDRIFSILDYHRSIGTNMWKDSRGWWISDEDWNVTKSMYCEREKIDFHIDDTKIYGKYFSSPFGHLTPSINVPRILEIKGFVSIEIINILNKYKGYYEFSFN